MAKLKIGIVEDEAIIAQSIASTLDGLGYDVAEPVGSYAEALQMIEQEQPDMLLLDIQLSGPQDGIDLAKAVRERYDLPFIFLTANSDQVTVERAKHVEPPAFLVKPFSKDDLFTSIEIAFHNHSSRKSSAGGAAVVSAAERPQDYVLNDTIFIKDGSYFHKVKFTDILYLHSDHIYVSVVTKEREFVVRSSLISYLENFDPSKFFRVHRRYVINVDHLDRINSVNILVNGKEIPIARNYRDDLLRHLRLG